MAANVAGRVFLTITVLSYHHLDAGIQIHDSTHAKSRRDTQYLVIGPTVSMVAHEIIATWRDKSMNAWGRFKSTQHSRPPCGHGASALHAQGFQPGQVRRSAYSNCGLHCAHVGRIV